MQHARRMRLAVWRMARDGATRQGVLVLFLPAIFLLYDREQNSCVHQLSARKAVAVIRSMAGVRDAGKHGRMLMMVCACALVRLRHARTRRNGAHGGSSGQNIRQQGSQDVEISQGRGQFLWHELLP